MTATLKVIVSVIAALYGFEAADCAYASDRAKVTASELIGSPYKSSKFVVPDGNWWITAPFDQKNGFLIGEESCYLKYIRRTQFVSYPGVYSETNGSYYGQIDDIIIKDKSLIHGPLTLAIRRILRYHRRPDRYDRIEMKRGYSLLGANGGLWSSLTLDERLGYVYGYLTCKHTYTRTLSRLTIHQVERRVSAHYGLLGKYARDDYSPDINRGAVADRISDLIDRSM